MIEEIAVPDIGEGVVSARLWRCHVKTGDSIQADDTVLELETDKAVVEIPSPVGGKVTEVLVREGDEIKIGTVIARVETGAQKRMTQKKRTVSRTGVQRMKRPQRPIHEPSRRKPRRGRRRQDPGRRARQTMKHRCSRRYAKRMMRSTSPVRPVPASPSIRRMARELGWIFTISREAVPADALPRWTSKPS